MAIAIGQFTIINMNDIPASALPPNNPSVNQLWMDISSVPNLLKKWDGSVWVRTGASSLAELDPAMVTAIDNAVSAASEAKVYTDNLALDTVITPDEKISLKQEWDVIVTEATLTTGKIPAQAIAFGVSHDDFDSAYSALNTYLLTTLNLFADMTTAKTGIVRTTWDTNWKNYYNARTDLLNAIATKAKTKADDAYGKADAAGYDALNASSSAATALETLRTKYTDSDLLAEMLGVINGDVARYSISNWCKDNNLTVIDGAKIATNSIEVGSLNAENLSAISSDLGIVTTGVIRSADYDAGSGIELDFRDTTEDGFSVKSSTKNTTLKIDADGTRVYNNSDLTTPVAQFVDSGVEAKKVTAEMGVIAGLQITMVNGEVWLSSIL